MPRANMSEAMKASLAQQNRNLVYFYLFEVGMPGNPPTPTTVLLCSAATNITATMQDGVSGEWQAIGGTFSFDATTESPDLNSAQVVLRMSGVNQSIIALAINNFYIGRICKIYLGHRDPNTLALVASPVLLFRGYQNGGWKIEEKRGDSGDPHTVDVALTAMDRLADLDKRKGIQTNVTSHQKYSPGDKFFEFVPAMIGKTVRWGPKDKKIAKEEDW